MVATATGCHHGTLHSDGAVFSGLFGRARSLVQNVRQYHQLDDPDSLPSRNIQEFVRGQLAGHHYDSDRDNARWLGYSGGGQPGLTTAAVLRGQRIRFDRVVTVGSLFWPTRLTGLPRWRS
ncbi:MAG: hypothetical protein R2857_02590 [Vampirovibrionales bacterium]